MSEDTFYWENFTLFYASVKLFHIGLKFIWCENFHDFPLEISLLSFQRRVVGNA